MNLSNYATKADLKESAGVDTDNIASKSSLTCLKAEVHKLKFVSAN